MARQSTRVRFTTSRQELLLQAALLEGPDALAAWRRCQSWIDLDHLDLASYRLLPLLYQNLRAQGCEDALVPTLRAAYQRTWCENEVRLHHAAGVLRALQEDGIHAMALKGAALVLGYAADRGVRPMADVDLLVPPAMFRRAAAILTSRGWTPHPRRAAHAHAFIHPNGQELDLHSHVLLLSGAGHLADEFREAAIRTSLEGVPIDVPCPADQLLHVCVHGALWSPLPLRWVADACHVMRSERAVDWDRLVARTGRHALGLYVRGALEFLQDVLNAPVPAHVIDRIAALPVSRSQRRDYAMDTAAQDTRGLATELSHRYRGYARWARGGGLQPTPLGFLRFLQSMHRLDHVWQLPGVAMTTVKRHIRERLMTRTVDKPGERG